VDFDDGTEKGTIAFNVCDYAHRMPTDGKKDFANLLIVAEGNAGGYRHLTSTNIEDVKVELQGKI
jgi:hypothetical protein